MPKIKKTVIVTGGAGRIGSALAADLVKQGDKVLLGDINKSKLLKIKKKLNSKNIEIFQGDLTTKNNIDRFIKFGVKKFKNIHAAVHCSYPTSKKWGARLEDLEEIHLKNDLQNQLGGSIIFSQRIMKYFLKQKKGNLILISSIQGIQAPKFAHYKNLNMTSPIEYSAIKSGIISITKYLSKYYKNKNIRINCVSPGGIKDNQPKLFTKRYRQSCNSKGLLDGEDISKLILFLLSDKSKYITGQNLVIDDGWSL
jgi:NAD(P)-dependent dehydrogenase (short-subunit alcohol dehydrogenase family)